MILGVIHMENLTHQLLWRNMIVKDSQIPTTGLFVQLLAGDNSKHHIIAPITGPLRQKFNGLQ